MIAADYPMAGNKDRDRIGGIGRCDCTHSLRVMDAAGKLAIRYGRSIGYFHQFFPYSALKFRAGKDNGNVEYLTVSGKIFIEIPDCPIDDVGSPHIVLRIQMSLSAAVYRTSPFLHRPIANTQLIAVRTDKHLAYGRLISCNLYSFHIVLFFFFLQI